MLPLNAMHGKKRHGTSHLLQTLASCNMCEATFPSSRALRHHKLIHHKLSPYRCDQCAKCFKGRPPSFCPSVHEVPHKFGIAYYLFHCNHCFILITAMFSNYIQSSVNDDSQPSNQEHFAAFSFCGQLKRILHSIHVVCPLTRSVCMYILL